MAEWKTLMLDVARGKYVSLAEAEAALAEARANTEALISQNQDAMLKQQDLKNGEIKDLQAKLAEAHKETEAANKTARDLEHSLRKATTDYADLQAKLAAAEKAVKDEKADTERTIKYAEEVDKRCADYTNGLIERQRARIASLEASLAAAEDESASRLAMHEVYVKASNARIGDLQKQIDDTEAAHGLRVAALEAALREIEKGEGAFSMDHLTHADNTIDNMKSIAKRALEVPKEQQEN